MTMLKDSFCSPLTLRFSLQNFSDRNDSPGQSGMSVVIRLASPDDAAEVARIYEPFVTETAVSFEAAPPDALQMATRIRNTLALTPWIVCDSDYGILGYAYATRHRDRPAYRWCVEVSAYVRSDARRAGIGRGLYKSLFAVLSLQGFRNAYAVVTVPNPPSIGLHRSVGFTTVGTYRSIGYKLGAWHDVEWLEFWLADHVSDPPEPTPLPDLLASRGLDAALNVGLAYVLKRPAV